MRGYVVFGGGRVPYARRREYENRKHPQTKHYLRNAANKAAARKDTYFTGILK